MKAEYKRFVVDETLNALLNRIERSHSIDAENYTETTVENKSQNQTSL